MSQVVSYGAAVFAQDGSGTALGWSDTGTSMSTFYNLGIVLDFSGLGRVSFRPTGLTLVPLSGFQELGAELSIYALDELDPDLYSASLLPGARSESRLISHFTGNSLGGGTDFVAGTPFTFQFGKRYSYGTVTDDATLEANWQYVWARVLMKPPYRVALSIVKDSAGVGTNFGTTENTTTSLQPSVAGLQWKLHTGHDVGGVGRQARATFCARSGVPLQSDQLVEDGYTEGIWVHPSWYEPEDTSGENIEISDTERENDERYGADG